jgi:hypothetical protein
MKSNVTVILQMERNYPTVSSGIVSFKNVRTGAEVKIQAQAT